MVGTVEPRKGHEIVLKVLEELWGDENSPISLCMIGKVGWDMDGFIKHIKSHPESGNRLLFIENAPDFYLQFAYTCSSALIQASAGEGFGLPIIEAGQFGLPVICSDIPVFREIAGDNVTYFDRNDGESLKTCINDFINNRENGDFPNSSKIKMLTWEQSASCLYDLVTDKHAGWYAQINLDGTVTYSNQ